MDEIEQLRRDLFDLNARWERAVGMSLESAERLAESEDIYPTAPEPIRGPSIKAVVTRRITAPVFLVPDDD